MPEQKSQEQSEARREHEQRKRERLERLSKPRKSDEEILAERAALPKSERHKRQQERLRTIRAATATERVRVLPRDEAIRKAYRNIPGRMGFLAEGSVEWPLDQFTKRRLREGSVTIEEREVESRGPEAAKEPPLASASRNQSPTPPTS